MKHPTESEGGSSPPHPVPDDPVQRLIWEMAPRDLIGGVSEDQSFVDRAMGRWRISEHTFARCDFSDASATGAIWRRNIFTDCQFHRADLEFADLSGSIFAAPGLGSAPMISGAGFNGAVLREATLDEVGTFASSFADADFTGAVIRHCRLHGTFEGSLFHRATLRNTSFRDTNAKFADFSNAVFDDVSLDLKTLPYLFGLDARQLCGGVQIFVSAEASPLNVGALESIAPRLVQHFISTNDYFAAANLSAVVGDTQDLMQLLAEGIRCAWLTKDFRALKLICKLARHVEDQKQLFGASALRTLYDMITQSVARSDDPAIQTQFALHDGHIRAHLLMGRPDALQLEFQSRAELPANANRINALVIEAVQEVAAAAGMPLEVVAANFAFNSYPRHVVELRVVHETKGPSPWANFAVAALSMIFGGVAAATGLLAASQVAPPPQVVQVIERHHQEIKTIIIPETMVVVVDGLPVTAWENGRIVPLRQEGQFLPALSRPRG